MERGKLLVISGPSGVGKSTAIQGVRDRHPEMFFSVSATTRPTRQGDVNGVTYWFKTREEFDEMVRQNAFYEHAEYAGNCYGTPREPVERCLEQGIDVIMDIDVQGALQIQERCPDAEECDIAEREQDVEAQQRFRNLERTNGVRAVDAMNPARLEIQPVENDIAAAPGICVSFFTQGCPHHCPGC